MREASSNKQKITAQVLIAFGLFLLVYLIYTAVFKQGNDSVNTGLIEGVADSSGKVEETFSNTVTENVKLTALATKDAGKRIVTRDDSSVKVNQVIADSVSANTHSSVDGLRLPDRGRMQAEAIYREGLDAYLQKDYNLAYKRWSRAAELKHGKSYFNLGILAANSSVAAELNGLKRSEYYFKKAKKYKYGPAMGAVNQSLFSASENNVESYSELENVAVAMPQEPAPTVAVTTLPQTVQKIETVNTIADDGIGHESWVSRQNDKSWTIQVRAFSQKKELDSFIDQYEFGAGVAYFKEKAGNNVMYKLVIGSFKSRDEAQAARESLPDEIRSKGPWLRRIGDIKKTMIGS